MKFSKPFKYAYRGHRVVEFNKGDECPDDLVEIATKCGVIQRPEKKKHETKAIRPKSSK